MPHKKLATLSIESNHANKNAYETAGSTVWARPVGFACIHQTGTSGALDQHCLAILRQAGASIALRRSRTAQPVLSSIAESYQSPEGIPIIWKHHSKPIATLNHLGPRQLQWISFSRKNGRRLGAPAPSRASPRDRNRHKATHPDVDKGTAKLK